MKSLNLWRVTCSGIMQSASGVRKQKVFNAWNWNLFSATIYAAPTRLIRPRKCHLNRYQSTQPLHVLIGRTPSVFHEIFEIHRCSLSYLLIYRRSVQQRQEIQSVTRLILKLLQVCLRLLSSLWLGLKTSLKVLCKKIEALFRDLHLAIRESRKLEFSHAARKRIFQ